MIKDQSRLRHPCAFSSFPPLFVNLSFLSLSLYSPYLIQSHVIPSQFIFQVRCYPGWSFFIGDRALSDVLAMAYVTVDLDIQQGLWDFNCC